MFFDIHGFYCSGHVARLKYMAMNAMTKVRIETVDAYIVRCTEKALKGTGRPLPLRQDDDDWYAGSDGRS